MAMESGYEEVMQTRRYLSFRIGYLTEDLKRKAKEELGETEERKSEAIQMFRKMVLDEPKLVCGTDDAYLLQFLRVRKYDLKRTMSMLRSHCRMKNARQDLCRELDIPCIEQTINSGFITCLPYRNEEGSPVVLFRFRHWNADEMPMVSMMKAAIAILLFTINDPATQVTGIRIIVDMKGLNLKHIREMSPRYMYICAKLFSNTLPIRFKGFHLCNSNPLLQYVWQIFKLFLSHKLRKRVHFHGENWEELQRYIPKAILPLEYGGENDTCESNDWFCEEIREFYGKYSELLQYKYED